jgi:hypothetical protein
MVLDHNVRAMERVNARGPVWARRAIRSALLLWFSLGYARLGHAADSDRIARLVRLQAGATCLSYQAVVAEVDQWLYDARIPEDLRIEVSGSQTDSRSVRLRVIRSQHVVAHRAFEPGPARCSALQAAVGLAIALTIKATLVEDLGRPLPDDPAARVHSWSLSGAALLTYRLLPELAPGLELSVRRGFGEHLTLRLGALGVTVWGVSLPQLAATFNATLVGVRAEGCAQGRLARTLRAGVCLGGLGGFLYAAGADVASPTSSSVGVGALSTALDLELELNARWSLALGLSTIFLLNRVQIGAETTSGVRVESRALQSPGFALGLGPSYYF